MSGVGGMTPTRTTVVLGERMLLRAVGFKSLQFALAGLEVTAVSRGCKRHLPNVESRPVVYGVGSVASHATHTTHRPNEQRIYSRCTSDKV